MNFYESLEDLILRTAEGVRPPERLTVSEAAVKYRKLNNPGSYVGDWTNDITPYLVEPMNEMASLSRTGMVFVGPAQCGKTELFLNWQLYSVVCDPADMMLLQTSQTTARDFSKRRIDRLHQFSPEVGKRLIQRRNVDNTFDKKYASGMLLTLSWPTINELSGKPIPRLFLTDYDRMDQDVDGEGSPFDLARKRATSFKSHGMTVAESSPGYLVDNLRWVPQSPNEAPPTKGVLSLYNRGDRRRWFWKCVNCLEAFEPDFNLLHYPDSKDEFDAAYSTVLMCPHCDHTYEHSPNERTGTPGKNQLNQNGRWIKDGQLWTKDDRVVGDSYRSDISSFWLKGVAAAFTDWPTLVLNYLKAEKEYKKTGSQEALKTTVNVDQGLPYATRGSNIGRLPEEIKTRAVETGLRVVPYGVRFILATIDIQRHRFVVQVHGISPGDDIAVIDRFEITYSERLDEKLAGQYHWVSPGAYLEDWKLLAREVLNKTYELGDGSGRRMAVKLTLCDSGGEAGVTSNAYNFYRWLRDGDEQGADPNPDWSPNLHRRFQLIKGNPAKQAPRVLLSYPDSERKDRFAEARGEIPVLLLNTNSLKDSLDHRLDRQDVGGGRITFPKWLPDNFFTELTVEIKTDKGWENPKKFRNESWDLLAYCIAGCLSRDIGTERVGFWENPPSWALDWDQNDLVFDPVVKDKPFVTEDSTKYSLSSLGSRLA